jgi:hypothetical protein
MNYLKQMILEQEEEVYSKILSNQQLLKLIYIKIILYKNNILRLQNLNDRNLDFFFL